MEKIGKMKLNPSTLTHTALALCLSLLASTVQAAQIDVPGDYSTIQAAVNAAQTGDQINVGEGVYEENVSVDKSLTIIGDRARIDISNTDPALLITADDVVVSGFDVRTTGAYAVEADEVGGLVIDACQIYGGDITLSMSKGATITNCYSGGATFGIRSMGNGFLGGSSDVITHCEINAAYVGIDVSYGALQVVVESNTIANCGIGIDVGDSSDVVLSGNNVRAVESGLQPLRFWSEFSDCTVALAGNNVSAVTDLPIDVTAITLLNEGENTLTVSGHFNRLGASNAVSLTGTGTCVTDLTNNWWGKNTAPISDVSVSPWLVMSVSPTNVIATNGSVAITCSWSTNSNNQDVSTLGHIPDLGDGLFWADSAGYFVDPILDNRVPMNIVNGIASVLYYPSAYPGTVIAILDNQQLPVLINR